MEATKPDSQRLVRTYMATGRDEEAASLASGALDLIFRSNILNAHLTVFQVSTMVHSLF